nr:hypothetical protein [Tanacetum cinerariifolium]
MGVGTAAMVFTQTPTLGTIVPVIRIAGPVQGNKIARRVVDDLIKFSGQTSVNGYMNFLRRNKYPSYVVLLIGFGKKSCRNQTAQLNALITEIEAFDDPGEVFDTLIGLREMLGLKMPS